MVKTLHICAVALGALIALTGVGAGRAEAQSFDASPSVRATDERVIGVGQAIAAVRARYPGCDVHDAQFVSQRGGPLYVVRIVTREGRRVDVFVNARSGAVISQRGR